MSSSPSTSSSTRVPTLRASTGERFTIEAAAARFFVPKKRDGAVPVPVPNVDGEVLAMVLKWGKKHDDEEELRKWESGFVRDLAPAVIHKLITAADNLGGRDELVDLLAGKVEDMIKGKTSEQIRQMFRVANDFTPEEEEIRRKNF